MGGCSRSFIRCSNVQHLCACVCVCVCSLTFVLGAAFVTRRQYRTQATQRELDALLFVSLSLSPSATSIWQGKREKMNSNTQVGRAARMTQKKCEKRQQKTRRMPRKIGGKNGGDTNEQKGVDWRVKVCVILQHMWHVKRPAPLINQTSQSLNISHPVPSQVELQCTGSCTPVGTRF